MIRGRSFVFVSQHVRSASRYGKKPTNYNHFYGFRPSRTYPRFP